MRNLVFIFLVIVSYKVLVNLLKLVRCKHFLNKYRDWQEKPNWQLAENRSEVIKLLRDAGVKDFNVGVVVPMGYEKLGATSASVFDNFPSTNPEFTSKTMRMFHEAIGVYRFRILETFNPLYWIEFVINLPKHVFGFLGVSSESMVIKVVQVMFWIVSVVLSFLFALYKVEIETAVRAWIGKLFP